jgi:acyl-[acyl carrier protein]--UDP-N-acetylglucosamine O-acyltransferase
MELIIYLLIGAIGIVLVEAKSVFENLRQETKNVDEIQKVLLKLFENKEEIQTLISFLNSKKQEE